MADPVLNLPNAHQVFVSDKVVVVEEGAHQWPPPAGEGGAAAAAYSDLAHEWFGASGITIAAQPGQITGDPCVVWDGTQWVMFYFQTVSGAPFVRTFRRTAPTLEGPWSSAVDVSELAGYHKAVVLVDELGAPALVDDAYHLYAVSFNGSSDSKEIHHFSAPALSGPWTLGSKVIAKGESGSKDEHFADAPGVLYKDGTTYLWYMAAPASSLPTYGLAPRKLRATASDPDGPFTKDYADVIELSNTPGEWNHGYMGATQVLRRPNGKYIMILNCGDQRPSSAGVEHDGSRVGYAYSDSIDGPWVYDPANPTHTFDGTPSDALEKANIWKAYAAWDPRLKRWYLFYNTSTGMELITFARQGVYSYSNQPGAGGSYNIQSLSSSAAQLAGSRINLVPGVYRVRMQVNFMGDGNGSLPKLAVQTSLRVNGTAVGTPNYDFVGSYQYENIDSVIDRIIAIPERGYVDFTVQVMEGTPLSTSLARRLRLSVEKLASSFP